MQPTSLDQIWGDTGISKFKTLDRDEYESQLNDMNKSDLQTHATKVGLVPIDDTKMLKKARKELDKHVSSYKTPKNMPKKTVKDALKILGEGK